MRVAIGSDHAGFDLKQTLAEHLVDGGHEVIDLGTTDTTSVDYPRFGEAVGRAVAGGEAERGVAICGSGIGICMAANKVQGIRAATVHDVTSARLSRLHNDANVFCAGQRFIGVQVALDALDAFMATEFEGGRHVRRVAMIDSISSQPDDPGSN